MYFPFHLMRTANAVQTAWPARPLREADLPGARAIADEVLERFPRDWAHIVRSEIRTSIIAAVLPLAGALLFGWSLILLTLSVLLDGLALWAIEKYRLGRGDPRMQRTLDLALRCERAVDVAVAMRNRNRLIPAEEVSTGCLQQVEASLLWFSVIAIAVLIATALESAGPAALAVVFAGALTARLLELREALARSAGLGSGASPRIEDRPRSPETLLRQLLMIFTALVLYHALSMLGVFHALREFALLTGYLIVCVGLAAWWRRVARHGQRQLQALLASD